MASGTKEAMRKIPFMGVKIKMSKLRSDKDTKESIRRMPYMGVKMKMSNVITSPILSIKPTPDNKERVSCRGVWPLESLLCWFGCGGTGWMTVLCKPFR